MIFTSKNKLITKLKGKAFASRFYCHEYLFGRNAIYAALSLLKEMGHKRILLPAYSCGDEVAVAINLGFNVKFYNIQRIGSPFESIGINTKEILEKDILFLTHFFGIVNKSSKLMRLTDTIHNQGGFVIEDAAYALFSKNVGDIGDLIIFSLRKILPVPNGAILCCKEKYKINKIINPPRKLVITENNNFKKYQNGINKPGSGIHTGIDPSDIHGARYKNLGGYLLGIPPATREIINNLDIDGYTNVNVRNFKHIYNVLKSYLDRDSLVIANEIVRQQIPSKIFPIIVEHSSYLHEKITDSGILFTLPFWDRTHPFIDWSDFDKALDMKKGVIAILLDYKICDSDLIKLSGIILAESLNSKKQLA
ncbi:MAG: hypothetical protein WCI79_00130 [Candidatus Saccharibacteria bacterium]